MKYECVFGRPETTVFSGDVTAAIGELKAKPGGELRVNGSGALSAGCSITTSSAR